MSRSVDNVDLDSLVDNGYVLGKNGDAPLALKVIVVQNKFSQILGLAHKIGLVYHTVHESGLTVVDVGYDSYVSDFLHLFSKKGWPSQTNLSIDWIKMSITCRAER